MSVLFGGFLIIQNISFFNGTNTLPLFNKIIYSNNSVLKYIYTYPNEVQLLLLLSLSLFFI